MTNPRWPSFERAQGDTSPITLQVTNDGLPTDISGSTWLWYLCDVNAYAGEDFDPPQSEWHSTATHNPNDNKVNGGSMTITDAANGKIQWSPASTDVDTPGAYHYQAIGTMSDGAVKKLPPDITVTEFRLHPSLG